MANFSIGKKQLLDDKKSDVLKYMNVISSKLRNVSLEKRLDEMSHEFDLLLIARRCSPSIPDELFGSTTRSTAGS